MDVLLYSLEFQWPLGENDLFEDMKEIARRACVSKQFQVIMKRIKNLRIGYYLQQYPPLKCLSLDVQEFAINLIKTYTNRADAAARIVMQAAHDDFLEKEGEFTLKNFRVRTQELADLAIQWRFNTVTLNLHSAFPAAVIQMFHILVHLCFRYRSRVCMLPLHCDDCFFHEEVAMWLVFLTNIETILKMTPVGASAGASSAGIIEEDAVCSRRHEFLCGFLLFHECDHVHNGFRKLGDKSATETTRKGYYYGVMQPDYVSQYDMIQFSHEKSNNRSNNTKENKKENNEKMQLCRLFLSRYRHIWSYQEACNVPSA